VPVSAAAAASKALPMTGRGRLTAAKSAQLQSLLFQHRQARQSRGVSVNRKRRPENPSLPRSRAAFFAAFSSVFRLRSLFISAGFVREQFNPLVDVKSLQSVLFDGALHVIDVKKRSNKN